MEWVCSNEKCCGSFLPRAILDAELLITLPLGISYWGCCGNVLWLLCFQHTEGLPDTPESQDEARKAVQRLWLFQLSLPEESSLISLLSPGCFPNAGASATPSFAAVVGASFNCYPQPILGNCQIDLQVRLNL